MLSWTLYRINSVLISLHYYMNLAFVIALRYFYITEVFKYYEVLVEILT